MEKKLIIFMPSIEGGGVEKNFFLLSNYLSKSIKSITVITVNKEFKKDLDKEFKIKSTCIYNPFNDKIVKTKSQEKILFKLFNKK